MSTTERNPILDPFIDAPAGTLLLSVTPLALAVGQLANSYVNGLSPAVAVAFAAVMIAFAVAATRHHAAQLRLARLEGALRE